MFFVQVKAAISGFAPARCLRRLRQLSGFSHHFFKSKIFIICSFAVADKKYKSGLFVCLLQQFLKPFISK
jgi:hypothetical protein